MKQLYTLTVFCTLSFVTFISCQKELHFPEPEPVSEFKVVVDGKIYDLEVKTQKVFLGDTAILDISGVSPEITVRLTSKSATHNNGVGDYFLYCCNNDVFDRTNGIQVHYEGRRAGNQTQKGFIKIKRMDKKGYEGSYSVTGKAGTANNAPTKEYTGTFHVVF